MARFALCVMVSVSVAEADRGSPKPAGFSAVTVLTSKPIASGATVAVSENVATALTGSDTVVSIGPVPLAAVQLPPPAAVHVQLGLPRMVGSGSRTMTFGALLGPPFVTVMV